MVLGLALPFAATAEDAPGVFKIPGTDSTIKFYGYVQLDMTLDFGPRVGNIEDNDWATILPAVPAKGSPDELRKKPQLYMTARTSRFGIQTNTPTKIGNVALKLEADFNGPNGFQSETFTNSVLFRLRQANATIGGLLVGQTWTTFLDFGAAPDTVDFNGPGTLALVRNPMIRYTFDLGPGASLALAAENARGSQFGGSKFQTLPDFHANLGYSGSWGSVSIRGVTQYFRQTFTTAGGSTIDQEPASKLGVAGAISGSLKIGNDTLMAQFAGGPGIGRYLLNALGTGASGAGAYEIDANDAMKLWTVFGGHVAYTHVWTPEVRSNLVAAGTFVSDAKVNDVEASNGVQKQLLQGFVNTFWSFAKNAEFGIEFTAGQWKSFVPAGATEQKGEQYRVNSSFHYNFF
jgi:hypothetical protein